MLKKFIYGALLTATFAGGAGLFTSCKDNLEDLRNELTGEQKTLAAQLQKLQDQLNTQSSTCTLEIKRLKALINELQEQVNNFEPGTSGLDEDAVNDLIQTAINALDDKYAKKSVVDDLIARIEDLEEKSYECGCDLSKYLTKEEFDQIFSPEMIATLNSIVGESEALLNLAGNETALSALAAQYNELLALLGGDGIPGVSEQIQEILDAMGDLDQFQTDFAEMKDFVDTYGAYFKDADGNIYTVEAFRQAIADATWVGSQKTALEALIALKDKLNGDNLDALNTFLENNTFDQLTDMYNTLFPAGEEWGETAKPSYFELVKRVEANEKAIDQLRTKIDGIFGRLNTMVTSLVLQASTNNIIGNVNTPFGVNSMVLMTYFGENKANLMTFPANGMAAEFDSKDGEGERAFVDWASMPGVEFTDLDQLMVDTDENGRAKLGDLWFTVNPGTVEGLNVNNFSLVNSVEDGSKVSLTNVTKDDETLFTFGYSRAGEGNGNGLYRAAAMVNVNRLNDIKIHIEPGLIETLKNAVNNRTATDVARVVKAIYGQLQDVCEANALRYTYDAVTGYDAQGNPIMGTQKVYSQYGIAATAFKPLGFTALYGTSFRTLPNWRNIEIPKDKVNLGLGKFTVGEVTLDIDLKLQGITISPMAETIIEFEYPVEFDPYTGLPTRYDTFKYKISDDMNGVIDEIQAAIDEWLKGNGETNGLEQDIKDQIAAAVDEAFNGTEEKPGLVKDIENQVNDMMGSIQDKLYDLIDEVNNNYLGKLNRVGSYYQRLADRINNVLEDPNHYLQVMVMYRTANGNFARLSDTPDQATVFKGNGEAIELWPTNYCFETICPIYKKFVGVTKVTFVGADGVEQDVTSTVGAAANANKEGLTATPFMGARAQVALDIKEANQKGVYTYEIAYQGLDYTGHTSTNKYYIKVVRK